MAMATSARTLGARSKATCFVRQRRASFWRASPRERGASSVLVERAARKTARKTDRRTGDAHGVVQLAMNRRRFLVTLAAGMLAAPLTGEGQQPSKVWRVGMLGNTPINPVLHEMFK